MDRIALQHGAQISTSVDTQSPMQEHMMSPTTEASLLLLSYEVSWQWICVIRPLEWLPGRD